MGKPGGFLDFNRKDAEYRPVAKRLRDFEPVEMALQGAEIRAQAARCMDCGTPFCHGCGCPLSNIIPEINDLVYLNRWKEALDLLLSTSSFPEFTARICPALCEAACVLGINDEPVAIRQIELAVIENGFEKGYIVPRPPKRRVTEKVAVIGSGPAGLAVADRLNRAGCRVTVYDQAPHAGGILRYGLPNFKLEKRIVDRRIDLMKQEGVEFELGVTVGADISYNYLRARFGAVCLAGGSREPRDLQVPGRELAGIHFAMEYLAMQNTRLVGAKVKESSDITAANRNVLIIGGGDTGADCLGTALRQGARSVLQVEIMPKPPAERPESTPWPVWPNIYRESSSHMEGGERRWCVDTLGFEGATGRVSVAHCVEVEWENGSGCNRFPRPVPGTEFSVPTDLVLISMGFVGPGRNGLVDELGLEKDERGNIRVDENHMTSAAGVFAAGDMARGQSLVVRAIADGQSAADGIIRFLKV